MPGNLNDVLTIYPDRPENIKLTVDFKTTDPQYFAVGTCSGKLQQYAKATPERHNGGIVLVMRGDKVTQSDRERINAMTQSMIAKANIQPNCSYIRGR